MSSTEKTGEISLLIREMLLAIRIVLKHKESTMNTRLDHKISAEQLDHKIDHVERKPTMNGSFLSFVSYRYWRITHTKCFKSNSITKPKCHTCLGCPNSYPWKKTPPRGFLFLTASFLLFCCQTITYALMTIFINLPEGTGGEAVFLGWETPECSDQLDSVTWLLKKVKSITD